MTEQQIVGMAPAEEQDGEEILQKLLEDIEIQRKRFRKRFFEPGIKAEGAGPTVPGAAPLRTMEDVRMHFHALGREVDETVLSFLQDMVFIQLQQASLIADLYEMQDPEASAGTQFTEEDAERFERVLTYAKTTLEGSLAHPELDLTQRQTLQMLLEDANHCLGVLVEEPGEGDDDEEKPEATGDQAQ